MTAFVGFDPAVFPIITRVAQLARIKDRQKFEPLMVEIIKTAHRMAGNDPTLLKGAKKAGRLVAELEKELQDDNGNGGDRPLIQIKRTNGHG